MIEDNFLSQKKPRSDVELSQKNLENILKIKISSGSSVRGIVSYLKEVEKIAPERVLRFMVSSDFDIFIGRNMHSMMRKEAGLYSSAEELLPEGQVRYLPLSKKISFFYHNYQTAPNKNVKHAVEKKIKDFLISNGLEITGTFYSS